MAGDPLRPPSLFEPGQERIGATWLAMDDALVSIWGMTTDGAFPGEALVFSLPDGAILRRWPLQIPRYLHGLVRLDGSCFLACGGLTGGPDGLRATSATELLDLRRGQSVRLPDMPFATAEPLVARLPDGRILVAGGYDDDVSVRLFHRAPIATSPPIPRSPEPNSANSRPPNSRSPNSTSADPHSPQSRPPNSHSANSRSQDSASDEPRSPNSPSSHSRPPDFRSPESPSPWREGPPLPCPRAGATPIHLSAARILFAGGAESFDFTSPDTALLLDVATLATEPIRLSLPPDCTLVDLRNGSFLAIGGRDPVGDPIAAASLFTCTD